MLIQNLDTPCLLVNKTKVLKNIELMQNKMDSLNVTLRPHGKSAKSIELLNLLDPRHRQKITVSTVKEAEYYFAQGIEDIMYAVGISPNKLNRLANLIQKGAKISVVLDTTEQVVFLSEYAQNNGISIPVLIEIDCDNHRGGIAPDEVKLIEIAKMLCSTPGVSFKGIMTHAGGSYDCQNVDQIRKMSEQERLSAVATVNRLKSNNIACDVVSIGSTPTAIFSQSMEGITEVRAGVFIFNDLVMHGLGVCSMDDIALSVLTSVIGKNLKKNWLLVDAGWMAISRDRGTQNQRVDYGYGQVTDVNGKARTNWLVNSTNQEHGIVEVPEENSSAVIDSAIGSLLSVLPNHACATAAMHQCYYVTEDNVTVSDVWQRVNGW